jgi:hypothetical protein
MKLNKANKSQNHKKQQLTKHPQSQLGPPQTKL